MQVAGTLGLPSAITAAVLNVTVTDTATGWVSAYADGQPWPGTSTVNFVSGTTRANLAITQVGSGGGIRLLTRGQADVVIDVQGYFAVPTGSDTSGLFRPLTPARVLDTRDGTGGIARLSAGQTVNLQLAGRGNVPPVGAQAAVLNLTATGATQFSYLTVFQPGTSPPNASTLNFGPAAATPNLVFAPIGGSGATAIYNLAGQVDVVADVVGYFTDSSDPSATGGQFVPLPQSRILDSRNGTGFAGPLGQDQQTSFQVMGAGTVPSSGVGAVALNLTETQPSASGYVTAYPSYDWAPYASNLNFTPGQTAANAAEAGVGADGRITLFNAMGAVHLVADVSGYYTPAPPAGPLPVAPAITGSFAQPLYWVSLAWNPAASSGSDVTGYTLLAEPGNVILPLPAQSTSATLVLPCGNTYSVLIAASNGTGTGPPASVGGLQLACAAYVGGVTYHHQDFELSCEEAALQMALSHEGIYPSQAQELNDIGIDWRHGYYDAWNNLRWGDPYINFVGDPGGSEVTLTGYGTYYTTITGLVHRYGGQALEVGEGVPPADVYNAVMHNHPVVAWVSFDWRYHPPGQWLAFDGRWVQYQGPVEHTVTVVGVTPTDVYVFNPWFGPQWVSRATFEAAYATYRDQAVVVG